MEEMTTRAREEARYISETGCTLRACAAVFGVGKSTVHTDVTKRLKDVDPVLYAQVEQVLGANLADRHLRGGRSTKLKYLREKKQS